VSRCQKKRNRQTQLGDYDVHLEPKRPSLLHDQQGQPHYGTSLEKQSSTIAQGGGFSRTHRLKDTWSVAVTKRSTTAAQEPKAPKGITNQYQRCAIFGNFDLQAPRARSCTLPTQCNVIYYIEDIGPQGARSAFRWLLRAKRADISGQQFACACKQCKAQSAKPRRSRS
jgi:hypothetical protein